MWPLFDDDLLDEVLNAGEWQFTEGVMQGSHRPERRLEAADLLRADTSDQHRTE